MSEKLKRGGGYRRIRMGSLYLDDHLAFCGNGCVTSIYSNQGFAHIGNTVKGYEITWVKPATMDIFVADRVILADISWDSLEFLGLTLPRYTIVDGNLYVCRLLEDNTDESGNEWDEVLSATGDEDALWNWQERKFWVNHSDLEGSGRAMLFGGTAPLSGESQSTSFNMCTGYRPVLEPVQNQRIYKGPTLTLDGELFDLYALKVETAKNANNVFLILEPQTESKVTNRRMFSPLFMDEDALQKLDMYTLLLDGKPVSCDKNRPFRYYEGMKLELVDRFYGPEYLVNWRTEYGLCFTTIPILENVSDSNLKKLGFVKNHKPG